MFESFLRNFPRDGGSKQTVDNSVTAADPELRSFFEELGGQSFKQGLYRTIHPSDQMEWNERISLAFPQFRQRINCFGFDWLGSTFALDNERLEKGRPGVLMFELGTGEALEIPSNLISFHETELVEFGEAALAVSFYEEWLTSEGAAPAYDQCIGYHIPLFLGGADAVENLGVSDIDVYWHLTGQLIKQTRGLSPGTPVNINLN